MRKQALWKCDVCGYIHEGEAPPESCPVCGASAELFSAFEASVSPEAVPTVAADDRRIVVLGGGVAGLTAAEYARRTSAQAQITLVIHPDEGAPYYRLNLSRLVAGEITEAALVIREPDFFANERITLVSAVATQIDRAAKSVQLSNGATLTYDRLIVATGATPFLPPWPGIALRQVHALRTRADAAAVLGHLRPGMRCICIGGGLLGLEAAGALQKRGAQVTVLETMPSLLSRQLVPEGGHVLKQHLESLGLQFRCGVQVTAINGTDIVTGVTLSTGESLPAELVLVAAGVRPDLTLAKAAGLTVNKGLVVDDQLYTNDASILAAGDVAEHQGQLYGLWSAAFAQGMIAGCNAAGATQQAKRLLPSSRLKVVDLGVMSMGDFAATPAPGDLVERRSGLSYLRLVRRDGRLVGANLVGDTTLIETVTSAIDTGQPITGFPELSELFAAD